MCAAADYTTLKQAKKGGDFKLDRVRQVIREIGLTLAELDMDLQAYLTRSFCIVEIYASVHAGATLLVQMHYLRAFGVAAELAAGPVGAKKAQTRGRRAGPRRGTGRRSRCGRPRRRSRPR